MYCYENNDTYIFYEENGINIICIKGMISVLKEWYFL